MPAPQTTQPHQSLLFDPDNEPEPVLVFGEDDPHARTCLANSGGVCDCLHDLMYSPSLHMRAA